MDEALRGDRRLRREAGQEARLLAAGGTCGLASCFVAGLPDATLAETVAALRGERGLKTIDRSVSRFFKRHSITFKKTARASQQLRADVAEARAARKAASPRLTRPNSSSSTRPARTPR